MAGESSADTAAGPGRTIEVLWAGPMSRGVTRHREKAGSQPSLHVLLECPGTWIVYAPMAKAGTASASGMGSPALSRAAALTNIVHRLNRHRSFDAETRKSQQRLRFIAARRASTHPSGACGERQVHPFDFLQRKPPKPTRRGRTMSGERWLTQGKTWESVCQPQMAILPSRRIEAASTALESYDI